MDIRSLILLLLLSTSWNTLANKNTVYRWVDKNNVVHFSQQKPIDSNVTDLTAVSIYDASEHKKTNNLTSDLAPTSNNEINKPQVNEQDSLIKQVQNAEKKKQIFKKNCEAATANLKMLNSFKRVIYPDAEGNQRILSPEEKAEKIKLNTEDIDKFCTDD